MNGQSEAIDTDVFNKNKLGSRTHCHWMQLDPFKFIESSLKNVLYFKHW